MGTKMGVNHGKIMTEKWAALDYPLKREKWGYEATFDPVTMAKSCFEGDTYVKPKAKNMLGYPKMAWAKGDIYAGTSRCDGATRTGSKVAS